MDEEDFDDEIQRTIQIGQENLELLQLAADWCQNIGTEKGPMGTGLIESVYGLPVSVGSLRCDYAEAPTSFAMQLERTALEFYEGNCVGCPHRKPTSAVRHLGTWADEHIAEREAAEQAAVTANRVAEAARQSRSEYRRLAFGEPSASLQSILDLIDRVDRPESDEEAGDLLVSHAELSPRDFPDALLNHIVEEAVATQADSLLEAVVAVFEREGRPEAERMVHLAFQAIATGVGRESAGRVISSHAESFNVDASSLSGIIHLAAGDQDVFNAFRRKGDPAALLRFFDVESRRAVEVLSTKLRDKDRWTRADAAHATQSLLRARPIAGPLLLSALLDAVGLRDGSKYAGDPFPSQTAQRVVSELLLRDVSSTGKAIDLRMRKADARYAKSLWDCFHKAARPYRHEHDVPPDVSVEVAARATKLLLRDLDMELLEEVASSVEGLAEDFGTQSGLTVDGLLRLIVRWRDRHEGHPRSAPDINAALSAEQQITRALQHNLEGLKIGNVRARLHGALAHVAKSDADAFIDSLEQSGWRFATTKKVRQPLIEALGKSGRTQSQLDRISPLLLDVLAGDDVIDRAAALEAIDEIARHPEVNLSDEIQLAVLQAAADNKLLVFRSAIRALHRVTIPVEARVDLLNTLLNFARIYGPQRTYDHDVERAVRLILKLSSGEPYDEQAQQLLLEAIADWPSAQSAELLDRLSLDAHPAWPRAAVSALHIDPDPQWDGIHDNHRLELLRRLAALPSSRISPHYDQLEAIASERLPRHRNWAWAIADVLACFGEYDRALRLADLVLSQIPETHESARLRGLAVQIAASFRAAHSTLADDHQQARRVREESLSLTSDEDD